MKPPPFSYHDPATLEQAVELLATLDNAKALAGGQSLMPMLNMRFVLPDHVVDLNRVAELTGIRRAGETIEIGAMTRQRDLEFSQDIADACPLMSEALTHVGHRQTRNRGTIGGSLCHLDPAAELVCVAAALDAVVEVIGPNGRREIPFAEFPAGYMSPAIDYTEIVSRVTFPVWPRETGHAFVEFSRRHGDFAIVSAAAMLLLDGAGRITRAVLALGGVAATPLRMRDVEAALIGQVASIELIGKVAEMCRDVEAVGDVYVPASYRQHLACVMSRRALETALSRAGKSAAAAH
ncbi:MAG: xanthine dehydrogenase family protein subunit M [Beijerinckiaceae bacterium]|nr:xanthine dehydrogenase family protein subunit M [Beijerinckiaceae bacterium]